MRRTGFAFAALALAFAGCTTAASPSPSPAASSSPSPSPCPLILFSSELASQSLTDVTVSADGSIGTVSFTFGPPDPAWPAGPPDYEVTSATPPFTGGASGLPLEVEGDNHVRVQFTNMKLVDDTGAPLYDGPTEITSEEEPIHAVVEEEAFEGVVSWLIGYDGDGCVDVQASTDGLALTVTIGS